MSSEDECPVCLESLSSTSSLTLPCRHPICRACITELWDVQQHSVATCKDGHVTCPMCRSSHLVGAQGLSEFVAACVGGASALAASGGRPTAHTDNEGLAALTIGELNAVSRADTGGTAHTNMTSTCDS